MQSVLLILSSVSILVFVVSLSVTLVAVVVGFVRKRQWKYISHSGIVVGVSFVLILVFAIIGGNSTEDDSVASNDRPRAIPTPKPEPTPLQSFTVESFLRERVENVRRFDEAYKRERIEIRGRVFTVIGNQLHLEGPIASLSAVLYGLPDTVLDRVNSQDWFIAECRFDRYRDGKIVLSRCEEVK